MYLTIAGTLALSVLMHVAWNLILLATA